MTKPSKTFLKRQKHSTRDRNKNVQRFFTSMKNSVTQSSSGGEAKCYQLPVLWKTPFLSIIGEVNAMQVGRLFKVTHHRQHRTGIRLHGWTRRDWLQQLAL